MVERKFLILDKVVAVGLVYDQIAPKLVSKSQANQLVANKPSSVELNLDMLYSNIWDYILLSFESKKNIDRCRSIVLDHITKALDGAKITEYLEDEGKFFDDLDDWMVEASEGRIQNVLAFEYFN